MTQKAVALLLAIFSSLVLGVPAWAQQTGKIPRVGVLWGGTPAFAKPYLTAGLEAMKTLGWVEGQNFAIEYRFAERDADKLPDMAADLARLKVDVIIAAGDPAVKAARDATRSIPIVMVAVGDAVGAGFVASLARPGGNVTGLGALSVELSGKRLELLKQIVPRAGRVAVLWNPNNPAGILGFRETDAAARQLGVTLLSVQVRTPDEIEPAFITITRERADGLVVVTDPLSWVRRRLIVELAAKHRLPGVYELREFVDAGGLASYGPSLEAMIRRVAIFVDKILRGAKPADLPVEQPTQLELVLNAKAATALGLTFAPSLAVRADHILP